MDTNLPRECFKDLLVKKLLMEFEKRNIEGTYCATKASALEVILGMIPADASVSCGGSASLRELGLHDAFRDAGRNFLDPDDAQGGVEKQKVAHQALSADYYLMSANAIAASGEIITLDGIGNRAAALSFGPQHVVIVAGLNKVEATLEAAIQRAKTKAAPLTLLLFKRDYATYDELMAAAGNAWNQLVITTGSVFPGRLRVLLVGEDLGF